MAGRTEVILEFVGDDARLSRTLRGVEQKVGSVLGVIGKMGKVGAGASAFVGMANTAMTLGSALTTVAPAALALPGILAGVAVASQTAKLALSGFSDAVGGDSKAMAKLAPSAQASARAVQGLGAGFQQMRSAVQESFFAGLSGQIKSVGANLLELGAQELPFVARGFNQMAGAALTVADTPFFKASLATIIDNTAGALDNMRFAGANALSGLTGLSVIGSNYLPAIGTAIDGVAQKFNNWVDAGIESGSIQAMIDGAIAGFRTLGDILSTIGQTAASVWGAINQGLGASATPLDMLLQKVQMFQQALAKPEAQAALTMLGTAIRAVSDAFNAVLPHLISFGAQIAGVVLPAITSFANVVAGNGALFAGLILGVVGAVAVIKTLIATVTMVRGVMVAWQAVHAVFTAQWIARWASMAASAAVSVARVVAAGAVWVAQTVAQGAAALASMAATAARYVVQWVVMAAGAMARAAVMAASWLIAMGPIGWVIAAVVGLVALIIANWDTVVAWTSSAWSAVTGWISGAWDTITSTVSSAAQAVVQWITDAWNQAGQVVQQAWEAHVQWVANGVNTVIQWVRELPGKILGVLGNIGSLLVNSGRALIDGFWNGIKATWDRLVSWFVDKLNWFRGLWPFSPAKWGPFSGTGYVTYSGEALVGDFAKSLAAGMPAVASAAQGLMGAAATPLGGSAVSGAGISPSIAPTGGTVRVELTVSGGDSALAALLMRMQRTGQLQLKVA